VTHKSFALFAAVAAAVAVVALQVGYFIGLAAGGIPCA